MSSNSTTPQRTSTVPAVSGWYPDPTGRFEYRYHNGHAWT
ncbi:MAG: DUF2510 domain-containing protein, partial [Acidimicrobiia bacterium]|nr:DUF2510 domain-containing protein [Acidimicrobiia bacterium]